MTREERLEELREWLSTPTIEAECRSTDEFLDEVIGWSDKINTIALRARDILKEEKANQ